MGFFTKKNDKASYQVPTAKETPCTTGVIQKAGLLEFKCPTCPGLVSVSVDQIDPLIGTNVVCPACKGVTHVPGSFKNVEQNTIIVCVNCSQKLRVPFTEPGQERVVTCPKCRHEFPYHAVSPMAYKKTYGSIRVPIAGFSDLYYEHSMITGIVSKGESDLYNDYGLWLFCAKCLHQFPSTLTAMFAIQQSMAKRGGGGMFFNANSQASASDMDGLMKGRCAKCGHNELFVVVAEVPDEVRRVSKSKR